MLFCFRAINTDQFAKRVFKIWDTNQDGQISFEEFAYIIFLMTKAPKEEKLKHIFTILDVDHSGTLGSQEIITAIKQAHNMSGDLNFDYNSKGIQIFRKMDFDGNLKINQDEFVNACMKDQELSKLMEELISCPELFETP